MTQWPDRARTRRIQVPPSDEPTQPIRIPPPRPTPAVRRTHQHRPVRATPPPPAPDRGEPPWWQTINRDRRAVPPRVPVESAPPVGPPPPEVLRTPVADPSPRPPSSRPPSSGRTPPQRLRRGIVIAAGTTAVTVAVAIGAMLGSRTDSPGRVLDVAAAQRGVAAVLVDPISGYGVASVDAATCNNGVNPPVRRGESFSCDVVVDGAPRRVLVVFQDDDGTYAVDRPR